jgi:hypothetical protein
MVHSHKLTIDLNASPGTPRKLGGLPHTFCPEESLKALPRISCFDLVMTKYAIQSLARQNRVLQIRAQAWF